MSKFFWQPLKHWNWGLPGGLLCFIIFLYFAPAQQLNLPARNMLAIAILMALWWMTEALPLAVTSLLPLVLYPVLGIMKTSEIAPNYANHLVFLFMGGFLIANAIQKWNLHRRFALTTIYWLGTSPRKLILGFMLATSLLSMWISNTATAMMIMPIGLAVVKQLQNNGNEEEQIESNPFGTILMLGIAYSASIGGIATLIGTPPNLVFSGVYRKFFPSLMEITFTQWILYVFPLALILFILAYFYLTRIFLRTHDLPTFQSRDFLKRQLDQLGKMNRPQRRTIAVFCITALLWIFRSDIPLGFFTIPGWPKFLALQGRIQDSTIAIAMAILLFVLPGGTGKTEKRSKLLNWKDVLTIPWDILLLFGGGFALAEGIQSTGLANYFARNLQFISHLPPILFLFLLCISIALLTEITSNTAVATTILPVMAAVSIESHLPPLLVMLPATIAASCAFMLPVATPPNAIVFGTRYVPIHKMIQTGSGLIVISAVLIAIYFGTLGKFF